MSDTTIGYLLLGIGIVAVLAIVFAVTLRTGARRAPGSPPRGVHLPPPSWLPVVMAVGAGLLGAALSFRPDPAWELPLLDVISRIIHPVLGLLALLVLALGIWGWVRAAGHEWHETERGSHDGSAGH